MTCEEDVSFRAVYNYDDTKYAFRKFKDLAIAKGEQYLYM